MKIRHERIREAMNAWALYPGGRKTPVSAIVDAYFSLGMTAPELYDESHPDALSRNIQKIYRWVESDSPASIEKIAQLLRRLNGLCRRCCWRGCVVITPKLSANFFTANNGWTTKWKRCSAQ